MEILTFFVRITTSSTAFPLRNITVYFPGGGAGANLDYLFYASAGPEPNLDYLLSSYTGWGALDSYSNLKGLRLSTLSKSFK